MSKTIALATPHMEDVHVESAMQEVAIGYRNQLYIAPLFAPVVQVAKESDRYYIFDKAEWLRDQADTDRRPGTRAPRGGYTTSTANYVLNEMAQAHPIPDRIAANADSVIRPYERGVNWCMEMVLLRRERHVATTVMVTGVWGTDNSSATDWDDFSNGDPANDVNTAKRTVQEATGFVPNTMVIGQVVYDALVINPDALDRFKHTETGILTEAQVAQWLGIERLLVGKATRNTAAEGVAATMSPIFDDDALIMYVPTSPAMDEPAACYLFQKDGVTTKRWREEAEGQDVVEASILTNIVVTASDAGYFFSDIV